MARLRGVESRFRRLREAGIIDPDAFPRRRDGKLTQKAADRIETLYDRVGALIANPKRRPFHTYKPRKAGNLARAARAEGLEISRLKGVRGVPIPRPSGSRVERVRFRKDGSFRLDFREGAPVSRFVFIPADPAQLATRPREYGNAIVARYRPDAARVRTGPGFVNPEEHGEDLGDTLDRLTNEYRVDLVGPDAAWPQWLTGVELIDLSR